jgi:hypothetical protein
VDIKAINKFVFTVFAACLVIGMQGGAAFAVVVLLLLSGSRLLKNKKN